MTIDTTKTYYIEGEDLVRLKRVEKRLYSEKTMNADDMRDLAQVISFIFDHVYSDDD